MDIYDQSSDDILKYLIDECLQIGMDTSGMKSSPVLKYAVGVYTKQLLASHSIWRILNPIPNNDFKSLGVKTFKDFPGCIVILRAIYEGYLISNYILLNKEFEKCKNVMLIVFDLYTLREQYVLLKNMNSKLIQEHGIEQDLDKFKLTILDHREFNELPKDIVKFVNSSHDSKSNPFPSIRELADLAGISMAAHFQYYKYFSNYSHAHPLAINQIEAIRSHEETDEFADLVMEHTEHFLSFSLEQFVEVCKSENIDIKISVPTQNIIAKWKEIDKQLF